MNSAHPNQTPNQRLGSWKEIAAFFDCDERTLRRWEKERGLPVHRVPGGTVGRVFAYTDELSAWLSTPRSEEAALPGSDSSLHVEPIAANGQLKVVDPRRQTENSAAPETANRWKAARLAVAAIFSLGILSLALLYRSPVRGVSGLRATGTVPPPSRQDSSGGLVMASSLSHSPEAEQFYLKGRYYWNKRTSDGLNKAVDYFTQAIVRDPNYAPAYVGLADSYNLLREYTQMPSAEAYPRALAAAKKAVELDDQSSEAHASLAFALFYGMWAVADADREFKRAIDLNPNNAVAHHWYATYLMTVRRFPESLREIERAQTLDPSSTSILADKGLILLLSGRRAEGVALLKQMETTEPSFRSPHLYLKNFYRANSDYANFLIESRKDALAVHDSAALALTEAAEKGFASGGPKAMFENILSVQNKLDPQGSVAPFDLAITHILLGNKEEALRNLQAAYDQHDASLLLIQNYAEFNSLHDDPTYRDLLARMDLPVEN